MTEKQIARINWGLLAAIILINCYILLAPLIPGLQFWYRDRFAAQHRAELRKVVDSPPQNDTYQGGNKVVIPDLFMDQPILEGPNIYTANKGIWRLPQSSTPEKGGNTVLIGHRFLYSRNPAVFYNLDKLKTGDVIGVYWGNQKYRYQVNEIKVVSPKQTEVEAPTDDARLTLYTCTPLWTSKERLVVIAKQIGDN